MSYKQILLAIRGYEEKQLKEWERTRLVAYQVYCTIPLKEARASLLSYLPLPSDKGKTGQMTREERNKAKQFFLTRNKPIFGNE